MTGISGHPSVGAVSGVGAVTTAAVLVGTLGVAAACWVLAVHQMRGMDMGVNTNIGSFASFAGSWMSMMVAMMLPGAIPILLRRHRMSLHAFAIPVFVAQYITTWAVVGVVLYALYRPHGTVVAGLLVMAAGLYELTPVKRRLRVQCREATHSGWTFGLDCVGSSLGLMAIPVGLGMMSITWMACVAIVVSAQKLVPPKAIIDGALALTIVVLGLATLVEPSLIPGLIQNTPSMSMT
jgi:predicted metal-binding membrane protein